MVVSLQFLKGDKRALAFLALELMQLDTYSWSEEVLSRGRQNFWLVKSMLEKKITLSFSNQTMEFTAGGTIWLQKRGVAGLASRMGPHRTCQLQRSSATACRWWCEAWITIKSGTAPLTSQAMSGRAGRCWTALHRLSLC
jgi:hypothetical protein